MTAAYAEQRDPALPWGHWLRVVPDGHPLVDEEGVGWSSVRECFWKVRLGFEETRESIRDEQLELMLGVLLAKGRRPLHPAATAHDMMEGSRVFYMHYGNWLASVGFLSSGFTGDALVTDEGHAVTMMLTATRPRELGRTPVSRAAYAIIREIGRVVGPGASRMAAVEAAARNKPHAFVREGHVGSPGISLVVRDRAGPFARTVWAMAFADEDSRDAFYVWLCDRVDRWDAWARIAWESGGGRLTQRLFAMLVAEGGLTK